MIIKKMIRIILLIFVFNIFTAIQSWSSEQSFDVWLKDFKTKAIQSGISEKVVNEVMIDAKFLPKVIEYDRYQPEFYEDTFTYIKKRTSKQKLIQGLRFHV